MAGISKVVFGGEVKLDLTQDTVDAAHLLKGYTAHGANGDAVTGTCDYDANTSDATATAAEILSGKTAYKNGLKMTGTMTNNGAVAGVIDDMAEDYTIPAGYHDGSGTVGIDSTEKAKLIPGNIKEGVEILGVTGTLEPSSSVTAQAKSATPSMSPQTILPDTGYDYLSQVTVAAIPFTLADNPAGGKTLTIG